MEDVSLDIDSSGAGPPQLHESLIGISDHLQSAQEPSSRHLGLPHTVLQSTNGITKGGSACHNVGHNGTGCLLPDSFRGNDARVPEPSQHNGGFMGPPEVVVFPTHRIPKRPAADEPPGQPGKREAGSADVIMPWSFASAAYGRDAASIVSNHSNVNGVPILPATPQTAAALQIDDSIRGGDSEELEHSRPPRAVRMGSWGTSRTYFGFIQTFASMASGVINWLTRFPNVPHGQDLPNDQTASDDVYEETLLGTSSAANISSQRSAAEQSDVTDHSDCLQLSGVEEEQDINQRLLRRSVDDEWPSAKAENQMQNELYVSAGSVDEATNLVSEPLSNIPEHTSDPGEVADEMISASGSLPWGDLPAVQPAGNTSAESGKREGTLSTRSQRTHTAASDRPRCGTCYFCKRPSLHHKCLNELVDAWTKPKRKYKPRKARVSGIICHHFGTISSSLASEAQHCLALHTLWK